MKRIFHSSPVLLAALIASCASATHRTTPNSDVPALKDVFRDDFLIGAALNPRQFGEEDSVGVAIIRKHFDTITPENVLKWEAVHPRPGVYAFGPSDRYVAFGEKNGMAVMGHTLVWHNQTPRWVFQDANGQPVSRDTLLARMRDHIVTVVGRYRGRIRGWDVVNEALNEDGTLRQTPWLRIIGPDYIAKAFEYAHEADPSAELYYNDYSLENAPKRQGAVALMRRLLADGVPVKAIGLQNHDKLDWPSAAQEDSTIAAFAALGIKVNITELDVDVLPRAARGNGAEITQRASLDSSLNPYPRTLPESAAQALARQYADLFAVFVAHRRDVARVTFWGVRDGDSWLNNWPVRGRTSYPLLFDRAGRPKAAFDAVVRTAHARTMSN